MRDFNHEIVITYYNSTLNNREGNADDADLDDQTYEEDDDDFIPTEEIPADEPIPFPTNI